MCGMCVKSGFVYGRSAAVPHSHAGVCGCDDRERTPTETAFRRTGYTAGGVNMKGHCLYFRILNFHSTVI